MSQIKTSSLQSFFFLFVMYRACLQNHWSNEITIKLLSFIKSYEFSSVTPLFEELIPITILVFFLHL